MALKFTMVDEAIRYTMSFYDIERIKEYMFKYAGVKERVRLVTKEKQLEWHEIVLEYHKLMDEEIEQYILHSNNTLLEYLFIKLNECVSYYKFESVWLPTLGREIDEYNDQFYQRFLQELEKREAEFIESDDYKKYNHGDEMHDIIPKTAHKLGFDVTYPTGQKFQKFLIADCPPLIDAAFLHDYVSLFKSLLDNFKYIVAKHLGAYNRLKKTSAFIQLQSTFPPIDKQPEITLPQETIKRKLKVNVTGGQLLAFFRLLYDIEPSIFDVEQAELREFIIDNFITKRAKGDSMNSKKTANYFSSPDPQNVKYWINILKKMGENAAKF